MKNWMWITITLLLAGAVATFVILYVKEKNKTKINKNANATVVATEVVKDAVTGETVAEAGQRIIISGDMTIQPKGKCPAGYKESKLADGSYACVKVMA